MCKKTKYKSSNPQIDRCMRPLIKWLNENTSYHLVASCCGHNKYPMTIVVKSRTDYHWELLSNKTIPRKRNFYKRDKQGYFYIPESLSDRTIRNGVLK